MSMRFSVLFPYTDCELITFSSVPIHPTSPFPIPNNHQLNLFSMKENMRSLSFFIWLISLNMWSSSSTHFAESDAISLFYKYIHKDQATHFLRTVSVCVLYSNLSVDLLPVWDKEKLMLR